MAATSPGVQQPGLIPEPPIPYPLPCPAGRIGFARRRARHVFAQPVGHCTHPGSPATGYQAKRSGGRQNRAIRGAAGKI